MADCDHTEVFDLELCLDVSSVKKNTGHTYLLKQTNKHGQITV